MQKESKLSSGARYAFLCRQAITVHLKRAQDGRKKKPIDTGNVVPPTDAKDAAGISGTEGQMHGDHKRINPNKSGCILSGGQQWMRFAIRTHVLTERDQMQSVLIRYAAAEIQPGDILVLSEKALSCTQKRAISMDAIHPRPLARLLSRFVYRSPYGIGLSIPQTMEMALRECGTPRILFAAAVSAFGKLIGKRGWFYKVAGALARSIDGPCDCTIPPYNHCVVLGPKDPGKTAEELSGHMGCPVAIIDVNDLGADVLGASAMELSKEQLCDILRDNPLGQGREQTPIGIVRRM